MTDLPTIDFPPRPRFVSSIGEISRNNESPDGKRTRERGDAKRRGRGRRKGNGKREIQIVDRSAKVS